MSVSVDVDQAQANNRSINQGGRGVAGGGGDARNRRSAGVEHTPPEDTAGDHPKTEGMKPPRTKPAQHSR